MTEASRVQNLLNEQNAEIDRFKNRIEKLEAALREIDRVGSAVENIALWKAQRIARKALEDKQ